ncbi:MAG: stringent starvation protein B [Gammaproteobacteria bacterium]
MTPISDASMKPYFVRAIYDWCVDKRRSPRLLARAGEETGAPQKLAKDGKIVFNISPEAVRGLVINNDGVSFAARFSGGETHEIVLAMEDVLAIFDSDEGRGVFFANPPAPKKETPPAPPDLQVV